MKHVSFDVWNTLLKPNPAFATARSAYFAKLLNLEIDEVRRIYTETKKIIEDQEHLSGFANQSHINYQILMERLTEHTKFRGEAILPIKHDIEQLFFEHPPIIVDAVSSTVQRLYDRDITMSIGSNSNFISGTVMREFLTEQFGDAFSFMVFSDLINYAKPAAQFFDRIIDCASACHGHSCYNILHVGDSVKHDKMGAYRAGIPSMIIEGPTELDRVMEKFL